MNRFLYALAVGLALSGCSQSGGGQAEAPAASQAASTSDASEPAASEASSAALSDEVAAGPMRFTDITARAGITFRHNNGSFGAKWTPDTMGSGVAFLDFDGDSYADLFFVNGRNWKPSEVEAYKKGSYREHQARHGFKLPDLPPGQPRPGRSVGALYRNNRDGTFSEATRGSGLDVEMYGMGAAVGDYDNDGRDDLFVTSLERNFLFRNEGAGRFRDVSLAAGVREAHLSTSAAWLDYNRDGRLDLFVCSYADWKPDIDAYAPWQGQKSVAGPDHYTGQRSQLLRNEGGGHFVDVSRQAGISVALSPSKKPLLGKALSGKPLAGEPVPGKPLLGKALGVALCDYNNDLWLDIMVANDRERNFLFRNNQDGTFEEVAVRAGIAYSNMGQARAGMGLGVGDIDHANLESVAITNLSQEMIGMYRNMGNGLFKDIAPESPVGKVSWPFLGFGCSLVDLDNDSWLDLIVANGHVNDIDPTQALMRPLLFHNLGATVRALKQKASNASFVEIGQQSGEAMQKRIMGRGLACADIDHDGDTDVVISCNNGAPLLLRNDSQGPGGAKRNNSLRVVLRGTGRAGGNNRSGIGAGVWAEVEGDLLRHRVQSGSSYLSQSELPLTIGLGSAQKVSDLAVRWPSGKLAQFPNVAANQIVTIDEAKGIVKKEPLEKARTE